MRSRPPLARPRQIMGIVLGVVCRHPAFHEIVTLVFIASNRTINPLCCNTLTNLGSAYVRQTFGLSVLCIYFQKADISRHYGNTAVVLAMGA